MISIIKSIINTFFYKFFFNQLLKIFFLKKTFQKKKTKKNQARWIASNFENATSVSHYTSLPEKGPEIELLNAIKKISNSSDKILDIGANCGRFSNNLFKSGYLNLYAVDISNAAYIHSKKIFPDLNNNLNYTVSSFENFFEKIPDNFFDTTFTMGATIDLVHPTFDIVHEISRVTKKYSILQLQKSGPPFIRFWDFEFRLKNFKRELIENNSFSNFELKVYKNNSD